MTYKYKDLYNDEKILIEAVRLMDRYGQKRLMRKTRRLLRQVTRLANAAQSQF